MSTPTNHDEAGARDVLEQNIDKLMQHAPGVAEGPALDAGARRRILEALKREAGTRRAAAGSVKGSEEGPEQGQSRPDSVRRPIWAKPQFPDTAEEKRGLSSPPHSFSLLIGGSFFVASIFLGIPISGRFRFPVQEPSIEFFFHCGRMGLWTQRIGINTLFSCYESGLLRVVVPTLSVPPFITFEEQSMRTYASERAQQTVPN